jgi:hypothetical protein
VIALAAIRAAWGTALLLAPDAILQTVGYKRRDERSRRVTQALGGRALVQAVVTTRRDRSQPAMLLNVAVDATHSATMLAPAIRRPVYRRPAAASALAAGSFAAAAGLRRARRES